MPEKDQNLGKAKASVLGTETALQDKSVITRSEMIEGIIELMGGSGGRFGTSNVILARNGVYKLITLFENNFAPELRMLVKENDKPIGFAQPAIDFSNKFT